MASVSRVAFVCPRFASGPALGGAETLLKALAGRMRTLGIEATFLTTCATDHFTWDNAIPPGRRMSDGIDTIYFPVDDRNTAAFHKAQTALCRQREPAPDLERIWLAEGVNSTALCEHVRAHIDSYDRIIAGPYLFSLIHAVSRIAPDKMILVPCLHDEAFARFSAARELFARIRSAMFNTEPERDLAARLYGFPAQRGAVVGMGIESVPCDPRAFARQRKLDAPYLIYCGRRETMKGTPLLLDYFSVFRQRTRRDLTLVLTGSGRVDASPESAGHVVDAGFVSEQEKADAMAGALAFCHPSANESLSIVLLEAWLAGTPALVRAASPVLVDQCRRSRGGLWFRSYPEFEEELLMLLDQPDLAASLAASGNAYVRDTYNWTAVDRRLRAALGPN